jgi:hypothetical protein
MALKVIELLVDESLSGETRVEEIALVLQPAIETEMVYFNQQEFQSYRDYPQSVRDNARRAVQWAEKNGWGSCGTPVGKQRASQLAKGQPISLDTIKRMYSYLSRHKVDLIGSRTYEDGCGKLMYDAWGGREALTWSERKIKQIEQKMGYDVGSLSPWSQTTGTTKVNMSQEMDVLGYQTRFFYICPGALSLFKSILSNKTDEDTQGMIRSAAQIADNVFRIEAIVLKRKFALPSELEQAKILVDDFKDLISEIERIIGIKYDTSFMDAHIKTISDIVTTEEFELEDACWEGWEAVGLKEKDGRMVPNCVPKEEMSEIDGCGCGCWDDGTYPFPKDNLYFGQTLVNGMPVFEKIEDAEKYAQKLGCEGTHVHTIDGKEFYMACETHPEEMCGCGYNDTTIEEIPYSFSEEDINLDDYDEEDYQVLLAFKKLAEIDYEKFEAVVLGMNGRTEQEVYRRNHTTPKTYFRYERVLTGQPDREFCTSIEGRFFTRPEIDLLRDVNRDFGHKREPYSKWLYKGGPNCVHAWRKFLFQGRDKVDQGFAEGKAGIPPKSMQNQGYYSEETKRKSEQAYIISQQNMSKQKQLEFKVDGEKRMIYSPAMKPGILIPRIDEVTKERYFVTFKPQTIERMAQRYMIEKRSGGGHTNYEHSQTKFNDVYLVESWIVDGDQDKAYSLGYTKEQVPKGTWMVGFRCDSDEVWNMVKEGEIKGISIEGNFEYKFSSHNSEDYLIREIINIINQIQ